MIGQTFSHYRILERLGESDFPGPLYKAEELESHSLVALRVLHSSFGLEERKRLARIAAAASELAHPNVESLVEIGETDDGELFCCGQFRPGDTLDRWIAHGELAPSDAFDIVCQAAKGLLRAHRARIVHGALRPEMIRLLDKHKVEIVGFGFAVLAGEGLTVRSGDPVEALSYRSPEQIRGGRPHPRMDVWALGVMLYEMLSGRRPFEGSTAGSLAESILGSDPPPISEVWKAAPPELDRVVARALSKETAQRYQQVAEFARDLLPFISQLGKPQRPRVLPAVVEPPAAAVAPAAGRSKKAAGSRSKKAPSKKAPSKKAPSKKAPSKKAPSKKAPSKKAPSKKAAPEKRSPAAAAETPGDAQRGAGEPAAADAEAQETAPASPNPPAGADVAHRDPAPPTSASPSAGGRPPVQWVLLAVGLLLLLVVLAWLLGG